MGFFQFIGQLPQYAGQAGVTERMDRRHERLIDPLRSVLNGARVLDLAAHDGRWAYAFASAGAAQVVGVEGRQELIARFHGYPQDDAHGRVQMVHQDIFDYLEGAVARQEQFDVVAVLGIFYHIMDHARLLFLIAQVQPKLVIIDSEFAHRPGPVIALVRERTDVHLNAIPARAGQDMRLKGVPSRAAMEAMAEDAGFSTQWINWDDLPETRRRGVADYFRQGPMRRGSCLLRPALS